MSAGETDALSKIDFKKIKCLALLGIYKLGISHSFTDHMDLTHCQSWSKSSKISLLLNHCQVYVCLDASVLQLISPAKPSSTGLQRETTCLNFFTHWYLVSISSRGYYFLNLQSLKSTRISILIHSQFYCPSSCLQTLLLLPTVTFTSTRWDDLLILF